MSNKKFTGFTVGNRYLVEFTDIYGHDIYEVRVVEMSINFIKLAIKNSEDNEYYEWKLFEKVKVIEDLGIATQPSNDLPF